MSKNVESILKEIEDKIKKYEDRHSKKARYILLGHLAYFGLKIQCAKDNNKYAEFGSTEANPDYLKSYKGLEIVVNVFSEFNGTYENKHDSVEVLGF